jgi:hypothetical protein
MQFPPLERPHWFEIFAVLNLAVVSLVIWPLTHEPLLTVPRIVPSLLLGFLGQTLVGVGIRAAIAWRRGTLREYLGVVRGAPWLVDTFRMGLFSALTVHAYGWIKLAVPLLRHRVFDQELWNFGQTLFFNHDPVDFTVELFSSGPAMRFIDVTYANLFVVTLNVAIIYFASAPSRKLRIAFMDANTTMWLVGAWIYVAVPSLGPAYSFQDVWLPLSHMMPHTQGLQRLLMTNYQAVLGYLRGDARPVNIFFGVAAFPSLHVAFQTLVFLWMRRLWRFGGIVFGIVNVLIVIGSVVTGWHYVVDAIAGVILAWLCFRASVYAHHIDRWPPAIESAA